MKNKHTSTYQPFYLEEYWENKDEQKCLNLKDIHHGDTFKYIKSRNCLNIIGKKNWLSVFLGTYYKAIKNVSDIYLRKVFHMLLLKFKSKF